MSRALLLAGPALLFTRLAKPKLLEHDTRDRIYTHLQQHPGVYFRSLRRDLALPNGVLVHHLYHLERARMVRRRRTGRRLTFYPADVAPVNVDALHAIAYGLLDAAHRQPGLSQSAVAAQMGLSRQALNYHVQKLQELGLVEVKREGRETHMRVPPEAWARVGKCGACATPFRLPVEKPAQVRCPQCGTVLGRGAAPAGLATTPKIPLSPARPPN